MTKKTNKQKYKEKRQKNLTPAEDQECTALEDELIAKRSNIKKKIFKGCVLPNADPEKKKKLRKLRKKARGLKNIND